MTIFDGRGIKSKGVENQRGSAGGTIAWSGDVYQAELDLKAVYRVQTDLTGLVSSANYNNEKVPVDLIISLTGPLLSPEIGFAIDLPESPSSYQQELNRHFLNEEALHYQAFSLLMLGDFFQQNLGIQESINFESSLGNTTSELLVSVLRIAPPVGPQLWL